MLEVGRGVERSRCLGDLRQPNHPSMTMPTEHSVQAQRYKRSFKMKTVSPSREELRLNEKNMGGNSVGFWFWLCKKKNWPQVKWTGLGTQICTHSQVFPVADWWRSSRGRRGGWREAASHPQINQSPLWPGTATTAADRLQYLCNIHGGNYEEET